MIDHLSEDQDVKFMNNKIYKSTWKDSLMRNSLYGVVLNEESMGLIKVYQEYVFHRNQENVSFVTAKEEKLQKKKNVWSKNEGCRLGRAGK